MGILAGIGNIYFVYQFLKKLVTPFEKTEAFKLGIIDNKGKILKKRRELTTVAEKEAYNLSDTLIWNLKKILAKWMKIYVRTVSEPGHNLVFVWEDALGAGESGRVYIKISI